LKKAFFLISLLFLFLVLPFPSVFGDDWVSPTGFDDPDSAWNNEPKVYDDDEATFTISNGFKGWTPYLYLTIDEIACSKVHFYPRVPSDGFMVLQLQVDVYKDETWINVYDSNSWLVEWIESEFEEGQVSQMRLRMRMWTLTVGYASFFEVDFWEVGVSQYELNLNSLPFQNVNFTLNGTTYQTNYTDILDEGYYNITFPSSWLNNSITYVFKNWSDGLTDPSRILNLNANTTLTVTYILPPKIHILFVGASVVAGLICFVFVLAWKRKKR